MTLSKLLTTVACVLMLCAVVPTPAIADQAQYIYDDLGRLSQVIDGQGMEGNRQDLACTCDFTDQLDAATSLGDLLEAESLEDSEEIVAGEPTKLGHGRGLTPSSASTSVHLASQEPPETLPHDAARGAAVFVPVNCVGRVTGLAQCCIATGRR